MIFLPVLLDRGLSAIDDVGAERKRCDGLLQAMTGEFSAARTARLNFDAVLHAAAWVERVATLAARLPDTSAVKAEIVQGLREAQEALKRATGGA